MKINQEFEIICIEDCQTLLKFPVKKGQKFITNKYEYNYTRDHVRLFTDGYNQGPVLRKNFMLISHYRDQTIDDILK